MKGRILTVNRRCERRSRHARPSSSSPPPPVAFVIVPPKRCYLDVDQGTFHCTLQQDHNVSQDNHGLQAEAVVTPEAVETTMLTGATSSVSTATDTVSQDEAPEETATTSTSRMVRGHGSSSSRCNSSPDQANSLGQEEYHTSTTSSTQQQIEEEDGEGVDVRDYHNNNDSSSFATLSTKDSVSPTDQTGHKKEEQPQDKEDDWEQPDHLHNHPHHPPLGVVQSLTQSELSAHTPSLSLVEAMEKGDDSYFTEGFVSVGELPCI